MIVSSSRKNGFGIIEILITLGVLSVGILGVAALQSVVTTQSQDNKATAEALSIAQSRIEEMRNYTNSASNVAEFDTLYPDTAGFANGLAISGVSAVYTRSESIAATADIKDITVNVTWTDSDGVAQNVSLSTELSFISPRSAGDTALEASAPLVEAPTGRARLGEGQLPAGAQTTSNGDGTSLYRDGGTDLMLVFGDQIVLTLAEACQTEAGSCIEFVRIKGRVYIDTVSQSGLTPGDVYLVASDAAFCARHYMANGTTQSVTAQTLSTVTTPNGDYEYFDYTCYIGGGWHGNVGVILSGGLAQSDKVCIGDPVSINAWQAPVIATRRVYRGMLYKHDGSTVSGKQEMSDGGGGTLIRYYSQGLADSVELPIPGSGASGHDFVIASMSAAQTEGENCISEGVMVRVDANANGAPGDLFEGVPADFICLNDGLLDNYDLAVFGNEVTCPYDPSDPPSTRHVISGTINVLATNTAENDNLVAGVTALTSDGPGNCLVTPFAYGGSQYSANYECDVFDWGNGWNGYIEVAYDASGMSCTPNRLTLSGVSADTGGHNYDNCSPGTFAVVSGTVSTSGNRRLTNAVLSDGGVCQLALDGLSYQCITQNFVLPTWTGSIELTANSGAVCSGPSNDGVFQFVDLASGFHTQNVSIANSTNQCP